MKFVISRVLWIVSLLWIEVTVDAGPHDQGTECTSMPTEEGETVKVDISLSPEINLNNDTVYIYLRRNDEPDTLRCDRKTSGSALQCDILNGSPFQTEGLIGHKLTMYAPNATVNLDGVYVLGVSVNGALNKPINCNVTVVKRKEGQHLAASEEDNSKGVPISIVIGLIVAIIVLVVVIVVLIVFRRRSRRKKQGNRSKSGGADNVDREEEESKLMEKAAPAGEMNSKEKDEQPEQIDIIVEEEAKQPDENELLNPREEDSQTEGKKQKTQDDKSFQFPSGYISSKDPSAAGHQAEQSGGQAASARAYSNTPEERGCLSTETETSPKDAVTLHTPDQHRGNHHERRRVVPVFMLDFTAAKSHPVKDDHVTPISDLKAQRSSNEQETEADKKRSGRHVMLAGVSRPDKSKGKGKVLLYAVRRRPRHEKSEALESERTTEET
ncbi:uncharacterized protein [Littorina saxatilis]